MTEAVTARHPGGRAFGPRPTLDDGPRRSPTLPTPIRATKSFDSGHRFFGAVSRGLAEVVEEAARRWGKPNGYILGQEASGAFVGGLRYGEGKMYTRNAGEQPHLLAGPVARLRRRRRRRPHDDAGLQPARVGAIFQRFGGVDGSAYFVGGFGFTALAANNIVVVPIRSGVGARLGVNLGYLKFTPQLDLEPLLDQAPHPIVLPSLRARAKSLRG